MKAPGLQSKQWVILNLLLLAAVLAHSVYRDIHLDNQYPADLRNRVVGARLQKDGKLPYFFHWQKADYPRYADPYNLQDSTLPASNITASPFFHQLVIPFCELPQRTFSRLWLVLQYVLLAGMLWMISRFAVSGLQKLILLNVAILFTLTEAWKSNITEGQLYFIEAFLIACILFSLLYTHRFSWILSGIFAGILALTRPTAVVIFIPFLFYFRKYFSFLAAAAAVLVLYGLFVLSSSYEKLLWAQYREAIQKHIALHQLKNADILFPWEGPLYPYCEGYNLKEAAVDAKKYPVEVSTETGNIYKIYRNATHRNMSLSVLNSLAAASILILTGLFFSRGRKVSLQTEQIILFAFLLYMVVELFSPVVRYQYYVVQWLPLLLTAFLMSGPEIKWRNFTFLLLAAGLFLTITNLSWIYDRNTLGEIAWLCALLLIVFNSKPTNLTLWKQPSSWAPDRRA